MPWPLPTFQGMLITLRPIDVDRDAEDYFAFNREPRRFLFAYAFAPLGADAYETTSWAGNVHSFRSIESYGFELIVEREEHNEKHGRLMAMRRYRMSRERWRAISVSPP